MQFAQPLAQRHTRAPKHNFNVSPHTWEIQPICLAPVLPGETLDGFTIQSRVVTPPLKSRIVGWWLEYYFFYVKFRQMPDAANLTAMFIDPSTTLSPTAAVVRDYYDGRGYNFASQCLEVIVREWFRREGETWSAFPIRTGRPGAAIHTEGVLDSLIDTTLLPDGGAITGNLDDVDRARIVLEYRRQLELMGGDGSQVDYEEVLSMYGVSLRSAKNRDRPELLRYIREWSYPTNTVEPTTGVPTTCVSWAVTDRADKNRRFEEPGFIMGLQVIRPKVYANNQTGNSSVILDRAQRWLPPAMDDAGMERSLAEFTNAQGPFGKTSGGFTNGYWLDVRDLFNRGDQWIDTTETNDLNGIAFPAAGAINTRYPTEAFANSLVVTSGDVHVADGAVQLRIKTRHVDPS